MEYRLQERDWKSSERGFNGHMATYPVTETAYTPQSRPSGFRAPEQTPSVIEILDERYFVRTLRFERKRSERSHEPFALMLFEAPGLFTEESSEALAGVARAISCCTRETDVFGWYEGGRVLGLIVTQIVDPACVTSGMISGRIAKALQEKLAPEDVAQIKMRVRIFPDESDDEKGDGDEYTFYRDLSSVHDHQRRAKGAKRLIDVLLSSVGLMALSPLLLLIALLVKLTSEGPVLFRQERVGRFGVPFTFLKFRSMYVNNDPSIHREYVAKLISGNAEKSQSGNASGTTYKIVNDPRITPLGRVLRKSSLDELPQLINVLKGDMSLVGPRPPLPYEFERYRMWHRRRVVEVKPGITGLWQVMGRSRTTFDEMVRLDLRYVRSWSLGLDFRILLETPRAVLSGEGAY
jgi:lipopolysaccharide/colanic/teichoic acid biosynthesis glycosyltransferase